MSYVYKKTEPNCFTVGYYHYSPIKGCEVFMPESDHATKEEAAARVHYLNGGCNRGKDHN